MEVNADRLWESLRLMAAIGATPGGGVTRLALSDEDKRARGLFCGWLEGAGLDVAVDDLGNIFGWRPGTDPELPPVLLGSHLDTVVRGGRFDGALGTMAALEVARALADAGARTRRRLGVVAFTGEEGSRFEPSILGTSLISGRFSPQFVYSLVDRHTGATFGAELSRIGYRGSAANRPPVPRAFLELHIEQGPILDREGIQIGVVGGIVGVRWLEVRLVGHANHAGTTPMEDRRDALVAAAGVIRGLDGLARSMGTAAVATVGRIAAEPDVINVVPGRVTLGVDIRHPDAEELDRYLDSLTHLVAREAEQARVEHSIEPVQSLPVTVFDREVVETVEAAAKEHHLTYRPMVSGAGHDSQWMARVCPTAMIFVPSKGGRSHCEDEDTSFEDAASGCRVLATAALALARG
jgi:N-carbamoyl-L-amino-acid hydrolase